MVALDPRFCGGDEIIATSSRASRVAGPTAFAEDAITHQDVGHLMMHPPVRCQGASFAHPAIYGLEDLGLCRAARPEPSSPSATPPRWQAATGLTLTASRERASGRAGIAIQHF